MNSITIDIRKNKIKVNGQFLDPVDTINVSNDSNVFKTRWKGYRWDFSDPKEVSEPATQAEIEKLTATHYSFVLGLFEKTNQTYIEISGDKFDNGRHLFKYRIPIVF